MWKVSCLLSDGRLLTILQNDAVEPDVVKASGGGYGPGGGDWPSGGGGQGGCMDLKSKKKCLKGDKDEACAW